MRILRAKLTDYRGTEQREVEFGLGVTVLEGPNEVGKSSIAQALDLLFKFKDSSKHREVKETIPVDRDESPEVEFEIESGDYRFVYRKRFGKGSKTELEISEPHPENLVGDQAHERAEQILEETLDVDLWRALQVDQGVGIDQADLKDSAALSRALDQASGSAAAGLAEGAMFDRVQEEFERYFTPTGRPKGELSSGAQEIEELESELADLESQERALREDVDEHVRLAARLRRAEGDIPRLEADLDAQEKAWSQVEKLSGEVDRSTSEHERLQLEARRLRDARTQREQQANKLANTETRIAALRKEHAAVVGPLEQLRKKLAKAKDELASAQDAVEKAEALHSLRNDDETYLRAKLEAERLEERHQRVVAIREKVRAARAMLETNQLTDEELERIREADVTVRQLEKLASEAGTRLRARALSGISLLVDEDEVNLEKGKVEERTVTSSTTITIPDQMELTVTPGSSAEERETELKDAIRERDDLLRAHGAATVKDAASLNAERTQAERHLADSDERIAQDLRDLTFEELEIKRDRCQAIVGSHEGGRAKKPPIPKTLEAARELARKAEKAAKEARAREREASDRLRHLAELIEEDGKNEAGLLAKVDVEVESADELAGELEASRKETSDEDLDAQLEEAEAKVSEAKTAAEKISEKLMKENPDQVEARRDAARASLSSASKELEELRLSLNTVETRLDMLQEKGIFEMLEGVRSRLDHAQTNQQRLERRANAARLLHETLCRHRDEARRRYLEPLTTRIEALGRAVFGESFRVTLTDDLAIESRTLDGQTIPFDSLSKGAQEQLGLLARLAVAMIVSEDEGVPLILDDTLGYSDPDRMQMMAATIGRAAERCQIIILTCSPDRFRGIPGATVERLTRGG